MSSSPGEVTDNRVVPFAVPPRAPRIGSDREPTSMASTTSVASTTSLDSTASLGDPAWQPTLRDKLLKYRYRTVPGWFDRINGAALPEGAISSIRDDFIQARLRRRIAGDVALHTAFVTALIATFLYVPIVADLLATALAPPWKAGLLAASLPFQVVLLKLVLDAPRWRVVVFGLYTVSLSALLAAFQTVWHSPHDVVACSACLTLAAVTHTVLFGVQYKRAFLQFFVLWLALALVAGVGVGVAATCLTAFGYDGTVGIVSILVMVLTWTLVYETLEFLPKLTPAEAPVGVFLLHIDIVAVGYCLSRVAAYVAMGIVALAIACALLPAYAIIVGVLAAWRNRRFLRTREAWTCGLDCNCSRRAGHEVVPVEGSIEEHPSAVAAQVAEMAR